MKSWNVPAGNELFKNKPPHTKNHLSKCSLIIMKFASDFAQANRYIIYLNALKSISNHLLNDSLQYSVWTKCAAQLCTRAILIFKHIFYCYLNGVRFFSCNKTAWKQVLITQSHLKKRWNENKFPFENFFKIFVLVWTIFKILEHWIDGTNDFQLPSKCIAEIFFSTQPHKNEHIRTHKFFREVLFANKNSYNVRLFNWFPGCVLSFQPDYCQFNEFITQNAHIHLVAVDLWLCRWFLVWSDFEVTSIKSTYQQHCNKLDYHVKKNLPCFNGSLTRQ